MRTIIVILAIAYATAGYASPSPWKCPPSGAGQGKVVCTAKR